MVKHEIARQKAVDAWLDATTPKPIPGEAEVTTQVTRLQEGARDRRRQEVRRDWTRAPGGLAAAVEAVPLPEATDAMREAAIEVVWRVQRRARVAQFPISDNLSALMALVMADLSESQRETLMNLIYQRDIALTDLTLHQLRDFLLHCSMHRSRASRIPAGPISQARDHSFPFHMENLTNTKDIGYSTRLLEMRASLMSTRISSGCMTRISASG